MSLEKYITKLSYSEFLTELFGFLSSSELTTATGSKLDINLGFAELCQHVVETKKSQSSIFFVGNGASAAMASHMSADFFKTAGVRTHALNDVSLMSAVSNDISYESVYAFPLKQYFKEGDSLVTISSSGNSPNILRAIETVRELGSKIITFSGLSKDNKSRQLGDYNVFVPAHTYGQVETSHQILLHYWLDYYMGNYFS